MMEYNVTVGKFGAFYVNPGVKGDGLDELDSASMTRMTTKYSDQQPVMQFTGMHDNSGKEIYTGDLFHCIYHRDGHEELYEVVYSEGSTAFVLKRHGECRQTQVRQHVYDVARYDIIGNIYENPELIK